MLICTGMWGTAWERHGREFDETFREYWPPETKLIVYTDRYDLPHTVGEYRMLDSIPGYRRFLRQWSDNVYATGKKPFNGEWPWSVRKHGYSWKHDAVKWFAQALIPAAAAHEARRGLLVWLDSDVVTQAPVPRTWLDDLVGDYDGAYLGRDCYSEIGFWAVKMSLAGRDMVNDFASRYLDGSFMNEREYHSAYIWDQARKDSGLNWRNLSPGGEGHVFRTSPLADYLEHNKGGLKVKA